MPTRLCLRAMALLTLCLSHSSLWARDTIDIVGSSTVYPFVTVVAERFGRATGGPTPKIESTGSGGGFKLFCEGVGLAYPDITNASRRMTRSEFALCQRNGVKDLIEVPIGYDGIVIANSVHGPRFELTRQELFLALASQVPGSIDGELIDNPYRRWRDINPLLPEVDIEVLGPPPTSGTRDIFADMVMEAGCQSFDWVAELASLDPELYRSICHTLREDGAYIESGENDNLIVQKLVQNPHAVGIFGFSFLDQNTDLVKGLEVESVVPSFESIADKSYPISRPIYFYLKKAHVSVVPGIAGFIREMTSERAWGEEGYLSDKGMIPLSAEERRAVSARARSLTPLRPDQLP